MYATASSTPHPYRILAACDFTPESEKALRRAIAVADATAAELHVVYVEDPGTLGPVPMPDTSASAMQRLRALVEGMLPGAQQLAKVSLQPRSARRLRRSPGWPRTSTPIWSSSARTVARECRTWCSAHGGHHLKMHLTTGETRPRSTEVRAWGFSG